MHSQVKWNNSEPSWDRFELVALLLLLLLPLLLVVVGVRAPVSKPKTLLKL